MRIGHNVHMNMLYTVQGSTKHLRCEEMGEREGEKRREVKVSRQQAWNIRHIVLVLPFLHVVRLCWYAHTFKPQIIISLDQSVNIPGFVPISLDCSD